MRRTMHEPGFVHGDNGYRMGCGCGTCTEAQRARRASYEDRKRGRKLVNSTSNPSPNTTVSAAPSKTHSAAGVLAEKARTALQEVKATSAEAELLREQALTGARIVDEAVASGRPHLVASGNKILNESIDRLKALVACEKGDSRDNHGDDFLKQYMDI